MELEFFNRTNTYATGKNGSPTILFSESGGVRISAVAKEKMNLMAGQVVEFAFDKRDNQWYLTTCSANGFVLRKSGKGDHALSFNSAAIVQKIAQGFETNKQNSVVALVGGQVELNGRTLWPLLMKRKVVRP